MEKVKSRWASGIKYVMAFQCLECVQVTQADAAANSRHTTSLHLLSMSDCERDEVRCEHTDRLIHTESYLNKFTPKGKA